jgi:Carboxypeptidase regulatory-like domain
MRTLVALLLLAPSAFAAQLRGVVYSKDGAPVAKAQVRAFRVESKAAAMARVAAGTAERQPVASGETGDDGTFALEGKFDGAYDLVVTKDGLAPVERYTFAGDEPRVISVAPTSMRSGRVTSGGKPVADARVIAWSDSSALVTVRTDANGTYSMPDLRQCCPIVSVVHPDYAVKAQYTEVSPAASFDFVLERGRTVSGKVVDARGKPVAKASITQNGWPLATSADDGTFTAHHASAKERLTATSGTQLGTAPVSDKEVVITLAPGRIVSGSVRNAARQPIPGAVVRLHRADDMQSLGEMAVANEKGEFVTDPLPAGEYAIWATETRDVVFERKRANLARKETARVDFVATRPRIVSGIVRDEDKRPVGGASVRLAMTREPLLYFDARAAGATVTGPDGRFRLRLYELDHHGRRSKSRVAVLHPRYAAATSEPFQDDADPAPLTITLSRGLQVYGLVVDRDDKPVAGAGVIVLQPTPESMGWPIERVMSGPQGTPLFKSDAQGKFTLRLNDAPHDIAVSAPGFASATIRELDPAKGTLRVVLDPGAEIRGRIASELPPGATLMAEGPGGAFVEGTIHADRTFTLPNLVAGDYTLMLSAGAMNAEKRVRAPAADVVLELPQSGTLRGRVSDKATGAPVTTEVSVIVMSADGEMGTLDAADGTFAGPVNTGPKEITVQAEGYLAQTVPVTIEAGKTSEIAVALDRGRRVHGRVLSPDGRPLDGASVGVEQTGNSFSSYINTHRGMIETTDESGEYELQSVSKAAMTIGATRPGYQSRSVTVEAGENDRTIDIVLSAGRKAAGRVVDEHGAPVADARVDATAIGHQSNSQEATTDASGNFVLQGLGAGRYNFHASKPRVGMAQVNDVDIAAGPVVITLRAAAAPGTIRGVIKGYAEGGWSMGLVMAMPVTGEYDREATSPIARDGSFRIEDAPSGEVWVQAHGRTRERESSSARVRVVVPPGGEVEASLAMRTDIVVRGVVTESGQPAPGRRVSFMGQDGTFAASSGEGGAYELIVVVPGSYSVSVQSGMAFFQIQHVVTGSGTFDIEVAFTKILGLVLDEAGTAIAGATVKVDQDWDAVTATTDATGNFALDVSGNQPRTVLASKSGYAHKSATVHPGGPPLVLQLARSDGLRVRLVDARDGTTLRGYVVAVDAQGREIRSSEEPQTDGSVHVPLAHGAYRIAASATGYASHTVRASVPMTGELRLPLTPGGTLVIQADGESYDLVRLVLPNGEEYVRCHCNGIAEIRLIGQTTTIEHVAPGTYAMQLLDEDAKVKATYPVTVTEGAVARAEIRLPRE